jgi:hypothetical protein
MGPDKVSPLVLKRCAEAFAEPLLSIFSISCRQSTLPKQWKMANVTPIHKKSAATYQPVFLISIPCKIMESILKDKIMAHLNEKKLISANQHDLNAALLTC